MIGPAVIQATVEFYRNTIVELASAQTIVRGANGEPFTAEQLGLGIVRGLGGAGRVRVHWASANVDVDMDPRDLHALGRRSHLVAMYDCDGDGRHSNFEHKVLIDAGLEHNWQAERRPDNIVRALRDDRAVWTFKWNPLTRSMNMLHHEHFPPVEDEDAEALIVAELAK